MSSNIPCIIFVMYYANIQVIWLCMYMYICIPGGQESQSGNQVTVSIGIGFPGEIIINC